MALCTVTVYCRLISMASRWMGVCLEIEDLGKEAPGQDCGHTHLGSRPLLIRSKCGQTREFVFVSVMLWKDLSWT